jgi:hypothetical protein
VHCVPSSTSTLVSTSPLTTSCAFTNRRCKENMEIIAGDNQSSVSATDVFSHLQKKEMLTSHANSW